MINFKEELGKYQPILELDNIEDAIHSSEVQDMLDILQHLSHEKTGSPTKNTDRNLK